MILLSEVALGKIGPALPSFDSPLLTLKKPTAIYLISTVPLLISSLNTVESACYTAEH